MATGMQEVPALGDLSEPRFPYLENEHTAYFIGMLGGAEEMKHRKRPVIFLHMSHAGTSFSLWIEGS